MKFFKKTVSILMVVAMLFPNMTATYATAKETQDTTDTAVEESVSNEYSVSAETVQNGQIYINDQETGTVTLAAGDTVTVSLKADNGYDVATFYIKDADTGDVLASKETDDDIFTFTMPEVNLVVGGTFIKISDAMNQEKKDNSETDAEKSDEVEFDHYYSDIDNSDINTSDLFIQTSDADILTENTEVVSNYDDVYVVSCDSVEEARYMYSYYADKVDFISDMSNEITLAEPTEMEETEDDDQDAISNLNDIQIKDYSGFIALIDSGAEAEANLSIVGDDTSDSLGHGTNMYNYIKEENPDAQILSIKAFNGSTANVADIYAAIKLAIESKVSVINLSFTGLDVEKNEILKQVINEAIENDIIVIGAAGNTASSSQKYIPGCIDDVITVGAVDKYGVLYPTSNYDADVYVVAESTSEATARYSGIYTSGKESKNVYETFKNSNEVTKIEDADINEGIFTTDKYYLVKYLYVDKDMVGSDATIDSIYDGESNPVLYQATESVAVYKQNNIYMFYADTPWKNGVTSGDVLDYTFANGNNYGEVITDGVIFDTTDKIAYINENAFENGEFADGQLQILVPIDRDAISNITINVYNANGDRLYSEKADTDAFFNVMFSINDISTIYNVKVNGKDYTNYTYDSGDFSLNMLGINVSTIDIYAEVPEDIILSISGVTGDSGLQTMWNDTGAPTYWVTQGSYDGWTGTGSFTAFVHTASGDHGGSGNVFGTNNYYYYDSTPIYNGVTPVTTSNPYYIGLPYSWGLYSNSDCTTKAGANSQNGNYYKYIEAGCGHISSSSGIDPVAMQGDRMEVSAAYQVVHETSSGGYNYKLISVVCYPISGVTSSSTIYQEGIAAFWVKSAKQDESVTGVRVYKRDAKNNNPINGATFNIYNSANDDFLGTITTEGDGSGVLEIPNGVTSAYGIETSVPSGYILDQTSFSVPVTSGLTAVSKSTVTNAATKRNNEEVFAYIQKSSANTTCTNDNPNYSLEGAEFQIYSTNASGGKGSYITTVTTDSNGKTGNIDVSNYMKKSGDAFVNTTFMVTETKAPKGYKLPTGDDATDTFTVSPSNTSSNPAKWDITDEPDRDYVSIKLNKQPVTGIQHTNGSEQSLADAEFTVKFYNLDVNNNYSTTSLMGNTANLKCTTVYKTIYDAPTNSYRVYFDTAHKVSGDDPVTKIGASVKDNGEYEYPFGFITIQETKAPDGYVLTGSEIELNGVTVKREDAEQGTIALKITPIGIGDSNTTITATNIYDNKTATIKEYPKMFGFTMTKHDADLDANETQGNATNLIATFKLLNNSDETLWADLNEDGKYQEGEAVAPGNEVKINGVIPFKTDAEGNYTSYSKLLQAGKWKIVEIEGPEGYLVSTDRDGNPVSEFDGMAIPNGNTTRVVENGEVIDINNIKAIKDPIKRGGFAMVKLDTEKLKSEPQGNGDLTATYEIVNNSENKVVVNDTTYEQNEVVYTFTTQKVVVGDKVYYEHHSSNILLPYGTYTIREKTAATGYFMDDTRGGQVIDQFTIDDEKNYHLFGPEDYISYVKPLVKFDDGEGNDLNIYQEHSSKDDYWFTDTVKRGQVKVKKNDGDRKEHYSDDQEDYESRIAQGDATLQGATYDVINNSTYSILVDADGDGKVYEKEVKPGEVAITLTTDAEGYAETPEKYLPYGKYKIVETKAPEGYNLVDYRGVTVSEITDTIDDEDDVIDCEFKKVEKGDLANSNYNHTFYNDVIRGGVIIKKNDADRADHLSSQQGSYFLTKDYESRVAQGDASLEGATYDIINKSKSYVWVDTNNNGTFEDTEIYQPGDVVYTLVTDAQGYAETPTTTFLPYGTYDIVETEASPGYLNSTIRNGKTKQTVVVREEGKVYDFTYHPYDSTKSDAENAEQSASDIKYSFFEPIMRGGFKFDKRDEETGKNTPLGSANLEGTYKVINLSKSYVWVDVGNGQDNDGDGQIDHYGEPDGIYSDDEIFWPGEIIYTFKTDKHDGTYETPNNQYLPYGTYKVQEIDPPMGYLMLSNKNPELSVTFEVREEDKQYDITNKIFNYAVRGDLYFNKRDGNTSKVMAYIPFKITSLDQDGNEIESHIVYTDKNGYFNSESSYVRHGWKTNAGDQGYADYMAYYEEHGTWPEDDGVVIEGTQGHSGTWFGVDTQPVQVMDSYQDYIDAFNANKEYPNDGSLDISDSIRLEQTGAFPYGTYLIEELPCKGNEGFVMYKDTFVINFESAADKTAEMDPHGWYAGRNSGSFDYGNIDNFDLPSIETIALSQDTESHYTPAYEDLVIIDDVSLHHLTKNTEYRLHTTLWVADGAVPEQVVDADGNPVEVDKTIKPTSQEHFAKVNIEFDATLYKGKTITVYEELFDKDDKLIASHTDITDTEQQIHISDISTVLSKDGEHLLKAEKGITLTDKIKYVNFEPNKTYKVTDYLIDKDTLDYALDDNGKKISAETTFKADETGSGEAEIEFNFDAETLEGKTFVAFAEATNNRKHNLIYYGEHMDIEDAEQTVKFPSLGTQAFDEETGVQMSFADDSVTVVDTCEYKNVFAGLTLTIKGKLVDKSTGEVLKVNGQEVTAEQTFIAEGEEGTVDLTFTFDGTNLKNTTLVAYETMFIASTTSDDGTFTVEREIADHSKLDDAAETVYIPEIGTTASDSETEMNIAYADNEVIINDKVSHKNFIPGLEYKFEGVMIDQATGNPVQDANGNNITSELVTKVETADGSQNVTFTVDATALKGKKVVIYETAYVNNKQTAEDGQTTDNFKKIAEHNDINSTEQSITFPEIGTTAFDTENKLNITKAGQASITDTVEYKGLLPNVECVLEGQLVNKETKEILTDADGNVIKSTATFTPDAADGKTDVKFEFDASQLSGTSYVVFETLTVNGHIVAKHEDINSESQTIHVPQISTTLTDSASKLHYANADGTISLTDVCGFSNLIPNVTYVMKGYLVDQATGEVVPLSTVNNKTDDNSADKNTTTDANDTHTASDAIIAGTVSQDGDVVSVKFTPVYTEGKVQMPFTLDASSLDGKSLVAFEELFVVDKDGVEWSIAEHKDINSEVQTVHLPKIGTTAVNAANNTHFAENGKVVIKDTVTFSNLIPSVEVVFKGVLMSKSKNEPIKNADGNPVTAETRYTPDTADGSVELSFEFNSADYCGDTIVAFEEVYAGSSLIGQHKDINSDEQAVHIASIKTTLIDTKTNIKTTADGKTVLEDTVEFDGLIPGVTYVMSGRIMDQSTGAVLTKGGDGSVINTLIEGITGKSNEYIAETTFTPDKSSGTVKLSFEVDTTDLDGKTLVCYEKLYFENHEITKHEDLSDESQAVHVAKIGTTASSEDGKTELKVGEKTVLKDVIAYENLAKDTEFTIKGEVYDKSTGKSTGITAESKFTPKDTKGETTMNFTIDTTKFEGKELVVYEYVYYKDVLVASHADINSKSQTVTVGKKETTTEKKPEEKTTEQKKETPKTPDTHTTTDATPGKDTNTKTNDMLLVYIIVGIAIAGAGGAAIYFGTKRRKLK